MQNAEVADSIVGKAVEAEQGQSGERTAEAFTDNVEARVHEKTDTLQQQFGSAADALVGEVTKKEQAYSARVRTLVGPHSIDRTEDEGAAGVNKKGSGNGVVIGTGAADFEVEDQGYWQRVRKHEEIHQREQADSFDAQEITYTDYAGEEQTVTVVGDLTEGHASEANEASDLVAEYVVHREKFLDLSAAIDGGEERVKVALKSGQMAELQQEITHGQIEEVLEVEATETQYALSA